MITTQDLVVILFLVFLEGVLSIDNALVLALLAKPLPKAQRKKALTYGLVGAIAFRLVAVGLATYLIRWRWVQLLGAAYLVWIAVQKFFFPKDSNPKRTASTGNFWKVVLAIELTDIAFAVDSILAAVAMSPKFWVVFTGGFLGVILMRFAASGMIQVLEKFPRFEASAYFLVLLVGLKLLTQGLVLPGVDFHESSHVEFWIFWGLMLGSILYGFKPSRKSDTTP